MRLPFANREEPMTFAEFCHHARRCTYKPNTRIDVYEELRQLRVSFYVPDTEPPHTKIHISMSFSIPDDLAKFPHSMDVFHFVLDCVDQVEKHETREWFCVDGKGMFNPHLEGKE